MVAVSGMLYGMIGYFGMQLIQQHFAVPAFLFWRFFVATLWMYVLVMFSPKRRSQLNTNARSLFILSAGGAVCYSGCSAFYYLASLYIGTGPAMVVFYTFPVFVICFSMLFDQWKMNRYTLAAVISIMVGLLLLNGKHDYAMNLTGFMLGMLAALSYGVYVYSSQSVSKKIDTHWLTLMICLGCAVLFFALALITGTFKLPVTAKAWLDIFVLGVLATAIPIQLMLSGLKYISSVKASMLSLLEPVVTLCVGMMFLHERLVSLQIIGVIIILCAALTIQFTDNTPDADVPLK